MIRRHLLGRLALVALGLALTLCTATAQNLVANGDFEDGWTGSFTFQDGEPAGSWMGTGWSAWTNPFPATQWSQSGDPSYWEMPGNDGVADPDNNYSRIIGGSIKNANMRGGIVQQVPTTPGTQYDLQFDASFTPNARLLDQAGAAYGFDLTGQVTDGLANSIIWADIPAADWWNTFSRRFTASGSSVSIWYRGQVAEATNTIVVDVDNVSLVPATGQLITIEDRPWDPESLFPPPPPVKVTQLAEDTFQFEWTTDFPSDSLVEYDTTRPGKGDDEGAINYANSQYDAALVTDHSVVVSGLDLASTYSFRVQSGAPGYKTAISLNQTFQTPPEAQAFFQNGGFEVGEGVNPAFWTLFGEVDGRQGPHPAAGPTAFWGVKALEGEYFIGSAASYLTKNGGYYQRIEAQPNKIYTAIMNYKNFVGGGDPATQPEVSSIGIDPYGGVDWTSDRIIWADGVDLTIPSGPWSEISVDAQAQAEAITVFVKFKQKFAFQFNITAIDNVRLELPEYEASSLGDAKAQQNGANISFTPDAELIVTLVPVSETGFFYIEDADGTAGIRVESDASVSIGDRVQVTGKLDTNAATGERVLKNATATVIGTGSVPIWSMNNKAVGGKGYVGAGGLGNQGLLVKVWGEVKSFDFLTETMVIDDGSNVDAGNGETGLRVIRSGQYPIAGQYISIVGVVSSEVIDGKQVRVIRGRENMVVDDFEVIQF